MSKIILAAAAALLLASPALAAANNDAPSQVVSAKGVNLSDPAQAQQFYARLQHAARQVCQAGADGRGAAGPKT
ncbi:MAG: UrcA family protein [Caulobacteraceae bacterium]